MLDQVSKFLDYVKSVFAPGSEQGRVHQMVACIQRLYQEEELLDTDMLELARLVVEEIPSV